MKMTGITARRGCMCVIITLMLGLWWATFEPMAGAAQEAAAPQAETATASTVSQPDDAAVQPPVKQTNQGWLTFGLDKVPALQRPVLGNPLWQYVSSLLYIVMAFYVSKLLDFLMQVQLKRLAERSRTRIDDLLIALARGPVKVVSFVILMHIGLQVFAWPSWITTFLSNALTIVVAGSITYVAIKCVDLAVQHWQQRLQGREETLLDAQLFPVLSKSLKIFIVVLAILVTSQNIGMDITSLIASLSIGGLALGLAAQDTLGNLFGAVSIFIDKPFRIGDRVQLNGIDGTVESIGLRSTRVRNLDGHLITVPNKTMGNATITNVTRRPNIKTVMDIGITYDTPLEKVKLALTILGDIYRNHPMTHDTIISFNKFASSSLNIMVVHWWKNTDFRQYLDGMQQMNLEVKKRFDEAGIEFAFPTQTLYIKQDGEAEGLRPQRLEAPSQLPTLGA